MGTYFGELKRRALLAKQRMRMGYWQQVMEQKETRLNRADVTVGEKQLISEVQREEIRREVNVIISSQLVNRDELLYRKVKTILDEDEFVANPIGKLINRAEYDRLDEGGRQRYILQLSQKYRELRERYYKEKSAGG